MILFFHFLCLLARYIVVNISKSIRQKKEEISNDSDEEEAVKHLSRSYLQNVKDMKPPVYQNETLKFFPPIYIQRYETVALILQSFAEEGVLQKVVDFGCSELGLFPYLKNIQSIKEILEVDVNEELLKRYAYKAAPLTCDYLVSKGVKPLDVFLLAGSVADYDDHLAGCDAVICIELIEHLTEEVFYKLPFNIFYHIKPKIAIFTTPNADFNSLFPNFEGMRHSDHKFEWTRKEFYLWTRSIITQYPEYSVKFYGVGAGPEGTENLGCCSQVAVFNRLDDLEPFSSAREELEGINKYKLIKHYSYPMYIDTRTKEDKVIHNIQYQVSYLIKSSDYYNYEENETEIPLSVLKPFVSNFQLQDDEFLKILEKSGMELREKDNSWYLVVKESELNSLESSFEEEEEEDWLSRNISQSLCEHLEEDWDLEEESQPEEKSEFNLTGFQTARSLQISHGSERIKCITITEPTMKNKTQSAPSSSNKLWAASDSPKTARSKIPRKTVVSSFQETISVCEPFRAISKSRSLDSCAENQSGIYLTPEFSPLSSGSIDKTDDSGYPFSYSSPNDWTPEVSECKISSSMSREEEDVLGRGFYWEDEMLENGNSANSNQDAEGNDVEGLEADGGSTNDNLFFLETREFPPWLLNLGELAQPLFVDSGRGDYDEGMGEDTSDDSNQSVNLMA